jgi:hypothetical protein
MTVAMTVAEFRSSAGDTASPGDRLIGMVLGLVLSGRDSADEV